MIFISKIAKRKAEVLKLIIQVQKTSLKFKLSLDIFNVSIISQKHRDLTARKYLHKLIWSKIIPTSIAKIVSFSSSNDKIEVNLSCLKKPLELIFELIEF